MSRKLQSKARPEVYKVIKRVGDLNYILGDSATGTQVTLFKQPVRVDRIVLMAGGVLDDPIAEAKDVVLEQCHGTIRQQARDGRILVEFEAAEADGEFAHSFLLLIIAIFSIVVHY